MIVFVEEACQIILLEVFYLLIRKLNSLQLNEFVFDLFLIMGLVHNNKLYI